MRHDPIALYRHALRCDPLLADALARLFRRDRLLAFRADRLLQTLPRATMAASPSWRSMLALHRIAASMDPP